MHGERSARMTAAERNRFAVVPELGQLVRVGTGTIRMDGVAEVRA